MLAANHAHDTACCVIKAANPTCELEWTCRLELFWSVAHTRAGLDIIGRIFVRIIYDYFVIRQSSFVISIMLAPERWRYARVYPSSPMRL
jgi:hypothetical protein